MVVPTRQQGDSSEETFFLLALLLMRRLLCEPFLFSHVLLPCHLERLSDTLLIRVLGRMPTAGAAHRPKTIALRPAQRLMPQHYFVLSIANENTRPTTFGAGRWGHGLTVHLVFLAFLLVLTVLSARA